MPKKKSIAAGIQRAQNPVDAAMHDDLDTHETDALFDALRNVKQGGGNAAIVPHEGGAMELSGWQMTPTGLIPPASIEKHQYREFGRALLRLDTSMQWLLGDFVNIGDDREWGETYTQLAEETGYEEKTLRDYAYVSRNVEMSVRTDQLSFGHHKIVASMETDEQRHWLTRAADGGLSIAKLRAAIKESQLPPPRPQEPATAVRPKLPDSTCVNCGAQYTESEAWQDSLLYCQSCYDHWLEHNDSWSPEPVVASKHDIDALNAQMPDGVTVEHIGTHNASNMHEMAADLAEALQPSPPAPPPLSPDAGTAQEAPARFDYETFREAQSQWDEARRAVEKVRAAHMQAAQGKPVSGILKRDALRSIRDLVAHLHYIEATLNGD